MDFTQDHHGHEAEIVALFTATFTASESAEEGKLIGALAHDLMATTAQSDLCCFIAWDAGKMIGCIFFSRMWFANDARSVFVLAPVAVATDRQGQGVGQALLSYGLDVLRNAGVDVAVTYGDPNYYRRVGFQPVTTEDIPAPLPLEYPEGWLAQSLTDAPLSALKGSSRCVAALSDPAYW